VAQVAVFSQIAL